MSYINQEKYYTNNGVTPTNENWGSYQYVSLQDIITNFMLMYSGNHALVNNMSRYKVLFHAKRGIQELNYDAFKEIKSLQLTVYSDLRFVLPSDFVNWVRVSMFKDNTIFPLVENIQVQSALSYVQSATATFTYDSSGNVNTQTSALDTAPFNEDYYDTYIGARYGLNTETANMNPTFTIDKKAGVINFDSTMANQECILEYISDGMENGDDSKISVNKLFEDYIYAYIKYALINNRFGVQEYIVNRARKDKTALLRNAKIRLSNIHPGRLLMNLRGENKWIK